MWPPRQMPSLKPFQMPRRPCCAEHRTWCSGTNFLMAREPLNRFEQVGYVAMTCLPVHGDLNRPVFFSLKKELRFNILPTKQIKIGTVWGQPVTYSKLMNTAGQSVALSFINFDERGSQVLGLLPRVPGVSEHHGTEFAFLLLYCIICIICEVLVN